MSQVYGSAGSQADSLTGCHVGHIVEAPPQPSKCGSSSQLPSTGEPQWAGPVNRPYPTRPAASPFGAPTASLIQKLACGLQMWVHWCLSVESQESGLQPSPALASLLTWQKYTLSTLAELPWLRV